MKKGQGLSLNFVIVAAILMVVIIVVLAIFYGGTKDVLPFLRSQTTCEARGGTPIANDPTLITKCEEDGGVVQRGLRTVKPNDICCITG